MDGRISSEKGLALIIRSYSAFAVCLGLSGCYPAQNSYKHVEVSSARYFQQSCYFTVGPPSVAYFPYHGIFISLDVTYVVSFGLHVPEGTTVKISGNTLRLVGVGPSGPVDVALPIHATRLQLRRGKPAEFFGLQVDPFTSKDNFGPLIGDTVHGNYLWYEYVSTDDKSRYVVAPQGLVRGTVELPSISINGQLYQSEAIPFETRTSFNIMPINC